MVSRSRNRVVLRCPDGHLWWQRHVLGGVGPTPEAARAAYGRELARLDEDGLEVDGELPPPVEDETALRYRCGQPSAVTLRLRPGGRASGAERGRVRMGRGEEGAATRRKVD